MTRHTILSLTLLFSLITLLQATPPDDKAAAADTVLFPGLGGQQLLDSLAANFTPANVLSLDNARDTMFAVINNNLDSVEAVYSGKTIYVDPAEDPSGDAFAKGLNTEHAWPQSKGADSGNAQSNLHHLFPTRSDVNSSRNNHPFNEIDDPQTDTWYRNDETLNSIPPAFIDEYSESDSDGEQFEPREEMKGDIARAMFYFYTLYTSQANAADPLFFDLQKNVLFAWHLQDPPTVAEQDRSERVALYQDGLPNPFVLDTSLVSRAYFATGTNSPPAALTFSNYSSSSVTIDWLLPSGYDAVSNQLFMLIQEGSPVDDDPTGADVSSYTADSQFGSGSEVGSGSFAVFSGDNTTVTVTDLLANTTYHIKFWNTQAGAWSASQLEVFFSTDPDIPVAPGDIVITEIMKNPSAVSDDMGEWFEVYNRTDQQVDMQGWTIADNGIDDITIAGSFVIPAHEFAILTVNADSLSNGGFGHPRVYDWGSNGDFTIANGDDEIIIRNGAATIDSVAYDDISWPDPNGASFALVDFTLDNNSGANWVQTALREPAYDAGGGDFGSPGTLGIDQVTGGGEPDIRVPVDTLSFFTRSDGGAYPDSFNIRNLGDADLIWSIIEDGGAGCDWATPSPLSGTTAGFGAEQSVVVTVDPAGIASGTYFCTLTINSNDPDSPAWDVVLELQVLETYLDVSFTGAPAPVPAGGDTFPYAISFSNFTGSLEVPGMWVTMKLPNETVQTVLDKNPVIQPFTTLNKSPILRIPANRPAGTYELIIHIGTNPGSVISSDTTRFEKLSTAASPLLTAGIESSIPKKTALHTNYPNPFNPVTVIGFSLSTDSFIRLTIYNSSGQKVRTAINEYRSAGNYEYVWDATNDSGARVASGVYYYRFTSSGGAHGGSFLRTRRMILTK